MSKTFGMIGGGGGNIKLVSIEIITPPTKTSYLSGESFDPAGMVVTATYSNGAKLAATGYAVEPSGPLSDGMTSVTIRYTEGGRSVTTTQAVTVIPKLVSIAVTTPPTKTAYRYGEAFSAAGMVVTATYTDGNSVAVTGYTTSPATFTSLGDQSVTVKYTENGVSATVTTPVTVSKAAGSLSISPDSLTLDSSNPTGEIIVDRVGDGAISAVSSAPDIASVSVSGNIVTVTGKASGNATITISVAEGTNHTAPADKTCNVTAAFVRIYGVQWDGTSTTVWSRTDDAANFVNPTPYVSGASSYGSPFDDLYPWNGMVRVTDSEAGELVAIPKFWYKWTKSGNSLKLQIADNQADGFYTSPAHADRGDGKGERDVVYIGRYHCHTSNYKSQTGGKPKASITRSAARRGIHALGSTIWQSDIQLRMTIWMLYLVEFADWNTQKTIGKGCGNNSATQNMGYTDSMPYHTGTTKTSRDTYGLGTQYRNIEGLWDNVYDWGDGCYYNSNGLNIIMNPSNFSDSSGGTAVGVLLRGWPSAFTVATVAGLEWVIYPTAASGSESTYSTDYWNFYASGPCLYFGGDSTQSGTRGLFCVYCDTASYSDASIGFRLQKLP